MSGYHRMILDREGAPEVAQEELGEATHLASIYPYIRNYIDLPIEWFTNTQWMKGGELT